MALTCQKCRQAVPHESDSWCLGCSAAEALTAELRNSWGSQGSRALATDLVVSGLRQVRALRRLGLAAGSGRAVRGQDAAEGRETPRGSLPPPEPAVGPRSSLRSGGQGDPPAPAEVKREELEEEESESEASAEESPCTGAFPKSKAEPLPRRRTSEGGRTEPGVEEASSRIGRREDASDPAHKQAKEEARGRGDRQRGESLNRREAEVARDRKDKKERSRSRKRKSSTGGHHQHRGEPGQRKKKRSHRAGSKHQRLYRAAENPYKRFHHRRPDGYWDQDIQDFR